MDWGRYLKAMDAGNVEGIEDRRLAQMSGKAKLDSDEWDAIREHDQMMADWAD